MDSFWAQVLADFVAQVPVLLVSAPFVFLTWASGYLDLLWGQAKRNRWMAPSLARRMGRRPPTPTAQWQAEFGSTSPTIDVPLGREELGPAYVPASAYAPPKVKRG